MDTEKIKVAFQAKAENTIYEISKFIAKKGYPETSKKFAEKLYQFGNSLAGFPDKYPLCRFPKFAKRKLHCAVFDSTYFFTYKVVKNKLIIYNVIHTKVLK